MSEGRALGEVFCKLVHGLGHHKAAIGKGLVVFGVHLAEDGEACGRFATDVRADFAKADRARGGASAVGCRCRVVDRELVLVLGASPPTVVTTEVTYGKGHVVDDSVGALVGTQYKVGAVLSFAEHVGDTVGIDRFPLVVGINVFVGVGVRCCHHGSHHEGIHLGLGFLQVVSAVVVAAFKRSGKGFIKRSTDVICTFGNRSAAILGMACRVEPGFSITATVDAVELEGSILHHGIHVFANDEGARNIVPHLDAQAGIGGQAHVAELANLYRARRAIYGNGIAVLVVGGRVCPCIDYPGRRCGFTA